MHLILDELSVAPGELVTGQVYMDDQDECDLINAITIELVQVDSSTRSRDEGTTVVAATRLELVGLEPAVFTVELPDSAIPNFTTRHGQANWQVRAQGEVAWDRDVATSVDLEVREPFEPTIVDDQHIPTDLESMARIPLPKGQIFDTLMLVGLVGFGIYCFGLALHQYLNEDGGNGALGFSILMVAFIALMIWPLLQRHPLPIRGVTVEPTAVVFSRGQTVGATVTVRRSGLAIGLEGVERYAEDRRSEHGRNVVYPEYIFHDEWRLIDEGSTKVNFEIPSDALVSYSGDALLIGWRLVIIKANKRGKTIRTSGNITPLLVMH